VKTMYVIIWEYQVKASREHDFEKYYAPNGVWAKLFRRAAGYLNSELIRDPKHPRRYVTIDRWISAEAYDAFRAKWKDDYDALDTHCGNLMERESLLGTFTEM